jgi:hypothetical protein
VAALRKSVRLLKTKVRSIDTCKLLGVAKDDFEDGQVIPPRRQKT